MTSYETDPIPTASEQSIALPQQRSQNAAATGGMSIPSQYLETNPATIMALPGAWHGPAHFDALKPVLRELGMRPLVAWMSIDNPHGTYTDWANEAAEQARGYDRTWLLAHSRKGNVAPLIAHRIPVEGIIYLDAIIPGTEDDQNALIELDEQLPKHFEGYYDAIEEHGDELRFNKAVAEQLFCAELDNEGRAHYTAALRPMGSREDDIVLVERPAVREYAIIGQYDPVINPAWQARRAEITLGKKAVTMMDTGHSPFATHPHELGKVIMNLIHGETPVV